MAARKPGSRPRRDFGGLRQQPDPDRPAAPAPRARETGPIERVYGLAAVLAVMATHPERALRIAHTRSARKPLADVLREAARRRIAYREVEPDELSHMAGAVHHEGACLLARPLPKPGLGELAELTAPRGLLLALDGVENPHNVGAVLRSAAFFGARAMVIGDASRQALAASSVRVAEGGAEHVPILHTSDLAAELHALRARGVRVVGSDSHEKLTLDELRWPERCALVLGAEDSGLSPAVRSACDTIVRIAGNPQIESLNVAVAAGVLLASYAARSERRN